MESGPNIHSKILQILLHSKNIPQTVLINKLQEINESNFTPNQLNNIIEAINERILPFKQRIKNVMEENTGDRHYILINTVEDSISQTLCTYSDNEKDYITLLFTTIILANKYQITYDNAYNLCSAPSIKLKKTEVQILLQQLLDEEYLADENQNLTLGTQYIHECEPTIRKQFMQWVQSCNLCKELAFKYNECIQCHERFHKHCITTFVARLKKCPKCDAKWIQQENAYN